MAKRIRVEDDAFDDLDELYQQIRGTKQEIASEAIRRYKEEMLGNNNNETSAEH